MLIFRSNIALTRGPHARHPCTICLVHTDDLLDLVSRQESRTAQRSEEIYAEYTRLHVRGTMGRAEGLMKGHSLRPVKERLALIPIANLLTFVIRMPSGHSGFPIRTKAYHSTNCMA